MTTHRRGAAALVLGWVVAPVLFLVFGTALVWNDSVVPNAPVLEGMLSGWSVPEALALLGASLILGTVMVYTGLAFKRSRRSGP